MSYLLPSTPESFPAPQETCKSARRFETPPRPASETHRLTGSSSPQGICRGCGDIVPGRNLACNHLYSTPRVPPTPQKQDLIRRKIATLHKKLVQLDHRDEDATHDPLQKTRTKRSKLLKRLDELKQQQKAPLSNFHPAIPQQQQTPSPLQIPTPPPVCARPITPPSDTVECLHCGVVCSDTQVDCPGCGGKVQGQCGNPLCNRRLPIKHSLA